MSEEHSQSAEFGNSPRPNSRPRELRLRRLRRFRWQVKSLVVLCYTMTALVWWLLRQPEENVLATAVQLAPRCWCLCPWFVAALGSLLCWKRGLALVALGVACVLFPIMDFRWQRPWNAVAESRTDLVVASLNVGDFQDDVLVNLREIEQYRPTILAFQESESRMKEPDFLEALNAYQTAGFEEYFVASWHQRALWSTWMHSSMRHLTDTSLLHSKSGMVRDRSC